MKFDLTWSEPKKFESDNLNITGKGVYLIGYRDTDTGKRHVEYVGQGEIGERLADHFDNNKCVRERTRSNGRVGYYRYAKVAREDDRLDIERALYLTHGADALCNAAEPPGSGRYDAVEVEEVFA